MLITTEVSNAITDSRKNTLVCSLLLTKRWFIVQLGYSCAIWFLMDCYLIRNLIKSSKYLYKIRNNRHTHFFKTQRRKLKTYIHIYFSYLRIDCDMFLYMKTYHTQLGAQFITRVSVIYKSVPHVHVISKPYKLTSVSTDFFFFVKFLNNFTVLNQEKTQTLTQTNTCFIKVQFISTW